MFAGPLDTEWFQSVPPPKVSPAALAAATVDALRRGIEDCYVGDVAQDIRAQAGRAAKGAGTGTGAVSVLAAFAAALADRDDPRDRPDAYADAGISRPS